MTAKVIPLARTPEPHAEHTMQVKLSGTQHLPAFDALLGGPASTSTMAAPMPTTKPTSSDWDVGLAWLLGLGIGMGYMRFLMWLCG